jgi:phage tail-like protein
MWKYNKNRILVFGLILLLFAGLFPLSGAEFSVNAYRTDPYKQYKFRVKWDGKAVPGILSVDGLHREFQVVETAPGFKRSPGAALYVPIRIERGRTHDGEFEKWAEQVLNYVEKRGEEPRKYRKDITIELLNEAGQVVMAFNVFKCWPSKYSAIKALDSNNTEVAIESLVLEHEGWERDYSVAEPVQP